MHMHIHTRARTHTHVSIQEDLLRGHFADTLPWDTSIEKSVII